MIGNNQSEEVNMKPLKNEGAVAGACPVTPEWLRSRYAIEATGQTYEQWLESAATRLAEAIYQDIEDEGLSPEDAHVALARIFPTR